jgi:hypothetical protein
MTKHPENIIRELKSLIHRMHGDGELSDYHKDLVNDIVNEMLEEE